MTESSPRVPARSLIAGNLHHRLVERIAHDERVESPYAGRIVDQALAFLAASAQNSSIPLAPSSQVDIGWHAFILYTKEYAEFCERVAGRFLHHVPDDGKASDRMSESVHEVLARSVEAIEAAGYFVDVELWGAGCLSCNVDCSQCKNGCSDDPPPRVVSHGTVAGRHLLDVS